VTTNTSPLSARLSDSLSRWDLLQSEFYQAWSAGTLPRPAIAQYASEYGAFISRIADGWAAHGDHAIAAEEREHLELWRQFAQSMGTDVGEAQTPEVRRLLNVVDRHFSSPASSLGALYAFEAQQPGTSKSKLAGLQEHYPLEDEAGEKYFQIHAHDEEEPALLLKRMEALPADDQQKAAEACEETAEALRTALDGLYRAAVPAEAACPTA